jgi:4-oxalocrotonate tautomerase
MPLINVKLIEDVFTPDQKREIVERLTDAMVSIEGENMRPVTWVVVEEVASGDWGIGGKPLSRWRKPAVGVAGVVSVDRCGRRRSGAGWRRRVRSAARR